MGTSLMFPGRTLAKDNRFVSTLLNTHSFVNEIIQLNFGTFCGTTTIDDEHGLSFSGPGSAAVRDKAHDHLTNQPVGSHGSRTHDNRPIQCRGSDRTVSAADAA